MPTNSKNPTPGATEVIYRTAESVSPKHPDKLCDQLSDAILDAYLKEDPFSRVAIDVAGGHGTIFVTGEVTSKAQSVDIATIVHETVGPQTNGAPYEIIQRISKQSPEIAQGVNSGGAGDQGIMVGYATRETPDLLPLEYVLARNLNQFVYKHWPYDGKTQIITRNGRIVAIVASFQYAPTPELKSLVHEWLEQDPLARTYDAELNLHINPSGEWHIGGFDADSGLTGRKLAVDAYGPRIPLGGGAFSGKDGTKVDRSGAYMARHIAVEYLKKNKKTQEVFVYLAYAIGHDQPLEATARIDGVQKRIHGYDLSPEGIIKKLCLRAPGFAQRAQYGHF